MVPQVKTPVWEALKSLTDHKINIRKWYDTEKKRERKKEKQFVFNSKAIIEAYIPEQVL